VALPVLAADLEDGVAAVVAAGSKLRRAHAHSGRRVADLTVFAAYAMTALFGGTTAYDAVTAIFGGATARGTAAIFGIAAFGAT
jgi:hypothetical protein